MLYREWMEYAAELVSQARRHDTVCMACRLYACHSAVIIIVYARERFAVSELACIYAHM